MFKKRIALLMASIMAVSSLAGCGQTATKETTAAAATTAKQEAPKSSGETTAAAVEDPLLLGEPVTFPVKEPVTITYWTELNNNFTTVLQNMSETEYAKEVTKVTGIEVDYIHPAVENVAEQFNLMLSSKELPDIILSDFGNYPGGVSEAYEDGLIIDLKPYIEDYMPNFNALLNEYPEIKRFIENEEGNILSIPFIRGSDTIMNYSGIVMRKDWLDDLGLEVPQTIDEFENVLRQFKEQKGATAPWVGNKSSVVNNIFAGSYGILVDYFVEDGTVKYGPYDPRFKDFMERMIRWYEDGLIDSEYAVNDGKAIDAKFTDGRGGAANMALGGGMGKYLGLMENDAEYDLVGVPYPASETGEPSLYMQKSDLVVKNGKVQITRDCDNLKEALALLDYGYSKEGHLLYNFGIEGVSYEMVNGEPQLIQDIAGESGDVPFSVYSHKYRLSTHVGPYVQDRRTTVFTYPQQEVASENWRKNADYVAENDPTVYANFTNEETDRINKLQKDINTYNNETWMGWITGLIEYDYDTYINTLKEMGVEEVIAIRQGAYDRYKEKYPEELTPKYYSMDTHFYK